VIPRFTGRLSSRSYASASCAAFELLLPAHPLQSPSFGGGDHAGAHEDMRVARRALAHQAVLTAALALAAALIITAAITRSHPQQRSHPTSLRAARHIH